MAGTSKFLKLHEQILLEYTYTDTSAPVTYSTSDYGIEILTNNYNGHNYLFSPDNTLTDLGNLRSRSVVQLGTGSTEYVGLNTNLPILYNDYDSNLTSSSDLLQNFSPDVNIVYDRVRIHLMAGFDFADYEGFIFEIYLTRTDSKRTTLLSMIFKSGDNYQQFNSSPFLLADRLYSSYIDVYVPSVYYFTQSSKTDINSLHARSTRRNPLISGQSGSGVGISGSSMISIRLAGIYESRKQNAFSYYKTREISSTSINKVDEFDKLVAKIQEASDGDYYELYGEYDGQIFDSFMTDLNQIPGNNYVVFHEYIISEQVGTSYIKTSDHSEIQSSDFDKPIMYRPIIKYASTAVAYVIDYTLRLVNSVDNSQIYKKSQLISTDAKKYGKLLTRINLGLVPTIAKVYNNPTIVSPYQIPHDTVTNTVTNEKIVVQTVYVNTFIKSNNIKVSATPIKLS